MAPQPTALKPPSTARTAGRSGGCGGACDASRLSCFLFRPRKSRERRRKCSHTTFPTRWSHGLQHLRRKRRNARFKGLGGYTRHPSPELRTQRLTGRNRGRFGWGWYHYPRIVLRGSETLRGRVSERRTLPLLGLGRGRSQRTQRAFGTAMRLCASLSRGVAAPLGCVICLQFGDVAVFSFCAQCFLNVRGGGYHYTRRAPHVLETLDGRLSKWFICRSLRSGSLH